MALRGYGDQGNLPFLLMGTWEHEKIFQGILGTMWILGRSLEFLLSEQSKKIFWNMADDGNFSREKGNMDSPGSLREK